MPEYEIFVFTGLNELKQGEETVVSVRSTDTLETRRVRAILSSSPKDLPDGHTLWILGERGKKFPQPWRIKIIAEIGSLAEEAKKYY